MTFGKPRVNSNTISFFKGSYAPFSKPKYIYLPATMLI